MSVETFKRSIGPGGPVETCPFLLGHHNNALARRERKTIQAHMPHPAPRELALELVNQWNKAARGSIVYWID